MHMGGEYQPLLSADPKWNGDFQIAINLNNGLQSYGDLEIAVPFQCLKRLFF